MSFGTISRLVTGIEPDEEEGLTRVYINARYLGIYVVVSTEAGEQLRRAWGHGHLCINVPDDAPRYKEVRPADVEATKP